MTSATGCCNVTLDMKMVRNIEELARLAGVSKSTVSRALNDNPIISSRTRKQIQELAVKHNFYIDKTASSLSSGRTFCIGCTICNELLNPGDLPNTFHYEVMNFLSSLLPRDGYDMMLLNTESQKDDWPSRYFHGKRTDAFIVLSLVDRIRNIQMLKKIKAPFIVFGEDCRELGIPSVISDNIQGAYLAVRHLVDTGRRRIAMIKGPSSSREAADREKGYRKALQEAGLEILPELIHEDFFLYRSGINGINRFLDQKIKPDAVFSNSDVAALGAIDELKNRGLKIPDDMAIVGYDNLRIAEHYDPPLTTIMQDRKVCAEALVSNLLEFMNTGNIINSVLPAKLVVRDSA